MKERVEFAEKDTTQMKTTFYGVIRKPTHHHRRHLKKTKNLSLAGDWKLSSCLQIHNKLILQWEKVMAANSTSPFVECTQPSFSLMFVIKQRLWFVFTWCLFFQLGNTVDLFLIRAGIWKEYRLWCARAHPHTHTHNFLPPPICQTAGIKVGNTDLWWTRRRRQLFNAKAAYSSVADLVLGTENVTGSISTLSS